MPKIPSKYIVSILPNALELATAAAYFICIESKKAIQKKGNFSIALSGGTTPKILFELLATKPFINNMDWQNTFILFGDERFVPPTDEESNFKMATEALLSKVAIPSSNIFPISTQNISANQSAIDYQKLIETKITNFYPIDLVLLGIGEEGHTASIFPNSSLLTNSQKVAAVWVEEKKMERISFTMPFINQAKNVTFLVSGVNKAAILKQIFEEENCTLPAAKVLATNNTYWFLDEAASGGI